MALSWANGLVRLLPLRFDFGVISAFPGDGTRFSLKEAANKPFRVCFKQPQFKKDNDELDYAVFDLVATDTEFRDFKPLGLDVPLYSGQEACTDVTSAATTYFPVACEFIAFLCVLQRR